MLDIITEKFTIALSIYCREQELLRLGVVHEFDADLAKELNVSLDDLLFSRVAIGLLQQITGS